MRRPPPTRASPTRSPGRLVPLPSRRSCRQRLTTRTVRSAPPVPRPMRSASSLANRYRRLVRRAESAPSRSAVRPRTRCARRIPRLVRWSLRRRRHHPNPLNQSGGRARGRSPRPSEAPEALTCRRRFHRRQGRAGRRPRNRPGQASPRPSPRRQPPRRLLRPARPQRPQRVPPLLRHPNRSAFPPAPRSPAQTPQSPQKGPRKGSRNRSRFGGRAGMGRRIPRTGSAGWILSPPPPRRRRHPPRRPRMTTLSRLQPPVLPLPSSHRPRQWQRPTQTPQENRRRRRTLRNRRISETRTLPPSPRPTQTTWTQ